jgi:hypothetical protein
MKSFKEFLELSEVLKKVKTPEGKEKWAVVSKKDPSKVLQYYDGQGKPSQEWFNKVERRIQTFKHMNENVLDRMTDFIKRNLSLADAKQKIKMALDLLDYKYQKDPTKKSIESSAYDVTQLFDIGYSARQLAKLYKREYLNEALEIGTDEIVKSYKNMTPGEELDEQTSSCGLVTMQQIKEFEKFVDKMFEKFGIDFEFSKHFRERISDTRNTPCITMKEIASLIKKIYAREGKSLKKYPDAQVVLKDLQSDLNIPVVIDYDSEKDEFEVRAKTIMRKKNFSTPNPVIKY